MRSQKILCLIGAFLIILLLTVACKEKEYKYQVVIGEKHYYTNAVHEADGCAVFKDARNCGCLGSDKKEGSQKEPIKACGNYTIIPLR